MRADAWIKHFAEVFPMIGDLAEPRVHPASAVGEPKLAREELMQSAKDRAHRGEDRNDQTSTELRGEAIKQVAKGWLEGPFEYHQEAKRLVGDEILEAKPAHRFGVLRGDKLRAVDGLKRSALS